MVIDVWPDPDSIEVCFAAHTLQWKSVQFKPLYLDYGCLDKFVFLIEEKEVKELFPLLKN